MAGTLIGDLLSSSGILTPDQVKRVEGVMKQKLCSFESAVLELQLLSKVALYGAIADQLRVPYLELEEYQPDPAAREIVSESLSRQHRAYPLFRIQKSLIVAMADPTDLVAMDAIRAATGYTVEAYLSSETEISRAIDRGYGTQGEVARFLEKLAGHPGAVEAPAVEEGEAPIAQLVGLLMTQAVREKASDIHVEPEENLLRIRFRVDGVLREIPSPPKDFEDAIISRLKVMGNLDIAENRVPQDGHFQLAVDERRVDVRMSTLPTINGENVVLRILDASAVALGLKQLGFTSEAMRQFDSVIRRPYGIILSVGPTGSGKTTTLYSALMRISTIDRNIVTIEDPVEYRLGLIRQVQVNPKAGITFANGLRAILRQDPDVIMVGEIRDRETAEIAIQAALTGHLVFSTLHTNDAPSSVTRLLNMGIEPFLVSASLICVISQRLVRNVCNSCKGWTEAPEAFLKRLDPKLLPQGKGPLKVARGAGCPRCNQGGYSGRTAIFEMMVLDDEIREMILSKASVAVLREAARKKGMRSLWEDGVDKILTGVTTIEEVSRVTEQWEESEAPAPESPPSSGGKPASAPEKPAGSKDLADYQRKIASWISKRSP
ncbi:MAG: type II/IV secretion system protein [Candidatus Omnitrophica bacterium]|nr:type II/IV secretion system protein [Candidatus Omnitrophota bacterium]